MPKFAAVQMESKSLDVELNLERSLHMFTTAAEAGAEVVVFPECSLTGYVLSAEEAQNIAQPVPGPLTDKLVSASQEFGSYLVAGMIERDPTGQLYNAAVLIGPEGVVAKYHKTHLPCLGVDRFLAQGDKLSGPSSTEAGDLAMLICYDLRFPEAVRVLSLKGAHVILLPTAWPERASLYPDFINQARSEENRVFIVAANHTGEERGVNYLGRSIITDPTGAVLREAERGGEQILYAELDLTLSSSKQIVVKAGEYELDLFQDRRPDLYRSLSEN
jgi:predicted amidohydrolase